MTIASFGPDPAAHSSAADHWWARLRGPHGEGLPPSVPERISWYEIQARRHRLGHHLSEAAVLLLGAAVPATIAAGAPAVVPAVLGALVAAGTGARQLFRWGDNWIRHSRYLVQLQGEVVAWSTGAAPYQDRATAGTLLTTRVEELVRAESGDWVGMLTDPSRHPPTEPSRNSPPSP
ncbi:hypothetical protein CFP65_7586 [Kitasatospora sp. MMS16-BH015]|uniref:DUF4231 domain-containing protein n=1 Tax=Kitasatospora sp. MMS16-BH015 TaxID=2018025 RepID=UPI000CA3E402|nr:DUF4231 domain-containing protein [Kitasatospora sp. MMS16-BH015]AUG82157.1 hypothetical protein CFP65_7586 [Kitasatospora sp. MMS16-BH015]